MLFVVRREQNALARRCGCLRRSGRRLALPCFFDGMKKTGRPIADRRAIALFTGGKEMSMNKITDAITDAGLFRHVSGERLGKTKVRERITAALPPDVEVEVRLDGNRVARMTRPSPVNGKPNVVITTFHALEE